MIPKIIHQTWKTNKIPKQWEDAVESCKQVNKDFKYILWTDESMRKFVKTQYPEFYPIYQSYKHNIQRCDVFRYLVLYKHGGIYLDMDIVCKQSLKDLLHHDIVLAKSINQSSTFTNCFFMVKPKHPFIQYCIEHLVDYKDSHRLFGKHLHIMNSTGPYYLSNMINQYGKIPKMYVLTKQEFGGDCSVCNEDKCIGGVYFAHIKGQSWNGADSLFYNWVLCNHRKIIGTVLIGSGIILLL